MTFPTAGTLERNIPYGGISEIDYVLKAVKERVTFLRELSPLWELVQEGVDLNTIEWSQH